VCMYVYTYTHIYTVHSNPQIDRIVEEFHPTKMMRPQGVGRKSFFWTSISLNIDYQAARHRDRHLRQR